MYGISAVIAIVLILMIVIALASFAYVFFSRVLSQTTQAGTTAINTANTNMLTQMKIEGMSISSVYVRNIGQSDITNFSVYVNDVPANFNVTPSVIKAGQKGTVNIYDSINSGDNIKITSPQGILTSYKAPDPCSQAVLCLHFDENSGIKAYDSSGNGNTGTFYNDPRILIVEEEDCGVANSDLYNALLSAGFTHVTKNTSITQKSEIDIINPEIVIASDRGCSINNATLFNELYDAGYSVFTKGNDQTNNIRPIASSESTSADAPIIYVNTSSGHPITQGWTTSEGSHTDGRQGIKAIHPAAIDIADDTTNHYIEAIYLHESGKGNWYHQQAYPVPVQQLLKNVINHLGSYRSWTSGKYGNALKFDGVDDRIEILNSNSLSSLGAGDYTVMVWFKLSSTSATGDILDKIGGSITTGFYIQIPGDYIQFTTRNDSLTPTIQYMSFSWTRDTNWHNLVITVRGTNNVSMYLDGVLQATPTNTRGTVNNPGNIAISSYYTWGSNLNCTIDEVRIYNKAIY